MGKNSAIEWTHHTFNPWWGCVKVSPACKHCYAETWSKRIGLKVWGARAERRFFGETHWKNPLFWNRDAEGSRERKRVFCSSMADVFEDRYELVGWRERLWGVIASTPWLDWLLLTKRPENVAAMVPWGEHWPNNVWLGTTVESQEWADKRIPELLRTPAVIRFLSCEPMLGPISLSRWLGESGNRGGIHWVIAGGESGLGARPMHPAWVRRLRDECCEHGVAFHFKQWGNWRPVDGSALGNARKTELHDLGEAVSFENLGKKKAGRDLDGRFWDDFPVTPYREDRGDR